ncbi:glutathione S-transferase 1-like [Styela clava]
MSMEFLTNQNDPECWPVQFTMEALGLKYIKVDQELSNGIFQKKSAQRIPAIRDGNFVLSESRAIATYLCNKYGSQTRNTGLYPEDVEKRGLVDMMMYIDLEARRKVLSYLNIDEVLNEGQWLNNEHLNTVKQIVSQYEKKLSEHHYIAYEELTVADFFCYVTICLLDVAKFNFKNYPHVSAWKSKIADIPFEFETVGSNIDELKKKYQKCLDALKYFDFIPNCILYSPLFL